MPGGDGTGPPGGGRLGAGGRQGYSRGQGGGRMGGNMTACWIGQVTRGEQ